MRNLLEDKLTPMLMAAACLFTLLVSGLAIFQPSLAVGLVGLALVLLTLRFHQFYVVLAAVSLPFSATFAAATPIGVIPLCDVAALIAVVSVATNRAGNQPRSGESPAGGMMRSARVLIILAIPYFAVALYSALFNGGSLPTALQRMELVILWLVFGALLFRVKSLNLFITWFVGVCALLSVAWMASPGINGVWGIQKNPSGGFISAALIMVILSPMANKWRLPGIVILCGGLLSTGSRGSMLGTAVAVVLLMLFARQWKRIFLPFIFAAAGGLIAFAALPATVTARILSQDGEGVYNIDIRGLFITDALEQFRDAPWSGVGIGNYVQNHPGLMSVRTNDPHNVFAFSLAEGGYPLLAGFLIMCLVPLLWLLGKRKTSVVALALAVQVSTLTHAFVDVYWVRGTPAVGWLLLGAAAAYIAAQRESPGDVADSLETASRDLTPEVKQRSPALTA